MSTCRPDNIIRPAYGKTVVKYHNGDTTDIIQVILDTDRTADKYIDAEAAQCLRGPNDYETMRNVWKFVKNNLRYKADRPGHEIVKTPGALFTVGHGDCKSFSIAEAAILRALGFKKVYYRFTSYAPGDYTHVYVVVRHQGKDVILDAVHRKFDEEVQYLRYQDIRAAQPASVGALSQQPGVHGTIQNFIILSVIGLSIWAISTFKK